MSNQSFYMVSSAGMDWIKRNNLSGEHKLRAMYDMEQQAKKVVRSNVRIFSRFVMTLVVWIVLTVVSYNQWLLWVDNTPSWFVKWMWLLASVIPVFIFWWCCKRWIYLSLSVLSSGFSESVDMSGVMANTSTPQMFAFMKRVEFVLALQHRALNRCCMLAVIFLSLMFLS